MNNSNSLIICVRANQQYIDMLTDARFFRYRRYIEYLVCNSDKNSYKCIVESTGDFIHMFTEQQRLIRDHMDNEYQQYISPNTLPKGMIYLINRQHEYLVFGRRGYVITVGSYAQTLNNTDHNIEYHD